MGWPLLVYSESQKSVHVNRKNVALLVDMVGSLAKWNHGVTFATTCLFPCAQNPVKLPPEVLHQVTGG